MMRIFLRVLLVFASFSLMLAVANVHAETPATAEGEPHGSFELTLKDVESAVGEALQNAGAGEKIAAFVVGNRPDVIYRYTQPLSVEIKTLEYSAQSGKWNANLFFKAGEQVMSAIPVSGRFEEMVTLPVLSKRIHSGEVIAATDLNYIDFPLSRTRKDTIMSPEKLIGFAPKRIISADRPVREAEIEKPFVVRKNEMVKMVYKTPTMQITTQGVALDDGAEGHAIRVKNDASKKVIQAQVEAPGIVVVNMGEPATQTVSLAPIQTTEQQLSAQTAQEMSHETLQ